jgi:hypothetical protein
MSTPAPKTHKRYRLFLIDGTSLDITARSIDERAGDLTVRANVPDSQTEHWENIGFFAKGSWRGYIELDYISRTLQPGDVPVSRGGPQSTES